MKDLLEHAEASSNEVVLLKVGRHFRLSPSTKVIVGRDKEENERLLSLARDGDICFDPVEEKGPIGIGRGAFDQESLSKVSQIIARYSDASAGSEVQVAYWRWPDGGVCSVTSRSMTDAQLQDLRI